MSTALRFAFLLLCLPALLFAQEETGKTVEFGAPGETGSFRARFSKQTGGIVWLQATDHYVSLEKARNEQHENGDYLLLIDNVDHSLRLFQAAGGVFNKNPADADWQIEEIADGVRLSLDDGQGLVLEKVLRHDPKERGFVLEVTLRNNTSDKVGAQAFSLLGVVAHDLLQHESLLVVERELDAVGELLVLPVRVGGVHRERAAVGAEHAQRAVRVVDQQQVVPGLALLVPRLLERDEVVGRLQPEDPSAPAAEADAVAARFAGLSELSDQLRIALGTEQRAEAQQRDEEASGGRHREAVRAGARVNQAVKADSSDAVVLGGRRLHSAQRPCSRRSARYSGSFSLS